MAALPHEAISPFRHFPSTPLASRGLRSRAHRVTMGPPASLAYPCAVFLTRSAANVHKVRTPVGGR
jgi:hypothetical protein